MADEVWNERGRMESAMHGINTAHRRAFTLIEVLITVTILGIASAILIPQMGQAGILRVHGAVRQLVADITFAQADAVAFQERRAIVFDLPNSTYALVAVPGSTVDVANNVMYDPTKPNGRYAVDVKDVRFGGCFLESVDFGNGSRTLIFDALGGPVTSASGNTPSNGGTVAVVGAKQKYVLTVEAFTGRVTVAQDRTYVAP